MITNDNKEQSHRETPSVSGDSATQNSLEKGVIKLKSFVCEPKTLPRDHNTFNLDDCEQAIIVALADQKTKIRELIKNTRDNVTQRDSAQFVLIRLLREFDELK